MEALKKAKGFIRHELGMKVDLRYTPELIFVRDQNIAYGAHIAQVLKSVCPAGQAEGEEGAEQ